MLHPRRSELQETLQQDLAQMNITVEVVDVQVTQTSLEKIDQTDKDAMASTASTLFPALMMGVGAGVICGVCLCGCVAIVRWKKKRSSRNSRPFMPSSLPTIHGHLDAGVKKNTGKQRPPPLKRSDLWRPICSFSRERGLQKGCANYSSVSILSGGCLSLRRLFEPPGWSAWASSNLASVLMRIGQDSSTWRSFSPPQVEVLYMWLWITHRDIGSQDTTFRSFLCHTGTQGNTPSNSRF